MDKRIRIETISDSNKAKSEKEEFEEEKTYGRNAIATSIEKRESQYIHLRKWAFWMAVSVIIVFGLLEIYIFCNVSKFTSFGDSFVFLAIAPIASITFIVVSVMIGVFKQHGDPEAKVSNVFPPYRIFGDG